MDTLISGVTIVTMNEKMDVLFGAYLGVTQGKISYIGKTPPKEQPQTIIDGTGMVAIPGLVNCHTHLADTGLRAYTDDLPRQEALEQQLTRTSKLDHEGAKASALLGIAECLRLGITSVSDLSFFPEAVAEAAGESGIRANVALAAQRFIHQYEDFDFETDEQCKLLCSVTDKWHGYDGGRIRIDAGIHSQYTSNFKLWEALSDYAAEKGLGMQLHLAQTQQEADECMDRTGLGPAELLSCHRLFRVPAAAVGCAALEEAESKLLAKHKVSVVATPMACGKQGLPHTPICQRVKDGMNVALGTGGTVEGGSMDMFELMRTAVFAERSAAGSAAALPSAAALMMATVCGARAQGREGRSGMLKEGMDADIVLVDFSAPHLIPCHNVVSALVFNAKGGDVAMTMVGGKILYQTGKFPTIDLKAVVETLTNHAIARLFADPKE